MFALFESLGGFELLVVGIGALLLFGKDLPKVAADAGAQFTKLKRSLDSTWRDSGLEREVRQIRDSLPRDLSLKDVARTASEKLAVRLEEEERIRTANPDASGPVARGAAIGAPMPEPIEHSGGPPTEPPLQHPTDHSAEPASKPASKPAAEQGGEYGGEFRARQPAGPGTGFGAGIVAEPASQTHVAPTPTRTPPSSGS